MAILDELSLAFCVFALPSKIVFDVNVSVPARVAKVPLNGKVTLVAPIEVKVVSKAPTVFKSPPKVIFLIPLLTPVPPLAPGKIPVTFEVRSTNPVISEVLMVVQVGAELPFDFNTWPAVPTSENDVMPTPD